MLSSSSIINWCTIKNIFNEKYYSFEKYNLQWNENKNKSGIVKTWIIARILDHGASANGIVNFSAKVHGT